MNLTQIKKRFSKALIILLIMSQFAFVGTYLFTPKPAEAFWGIGDFTFNTEVANWYDVFKEIALGAAQRLAISYANKYITRFVDKLIDKYRIKDYLAYDKVLSGYYLNQYVYQNVSDPDLRAIYGLLATDINTRATVTSPTGRTIPVLAALKEKLDTYYINQGGIDSQKIFNPNTAISDREYFASAQAYFANPPSFTQYELYGEFGQLVTDSQKASAQEIGSSTGGLKNDRSKPPSATGTGLIDRYCDGGYRYPASYPNPDDPFGDEIPYPRDPITNQADCTIATGVWKVDTLGITQSVIQNPSAFVHDFATNGIKQIFESNFGLHDNLYSTIGSLLGDFLFKKLSLTTDKTSGQGFDGVLNEKGTDYKADSGRVPLLKNVDRDGDNIPDGQDVDGDGALNTPSVDICYHGGTAPNCVNSKNAVSSPYFTPICTAIDRAVTALTEYTRFINTYSSQFKDSDNFENKADADVWARRTGEVDSAITEITNTIQSYHSPYFDNMEFSVGRYSVFIGTVLQSLQKDKDLDLSTNPFSSGAQGGLPSLKYFTGLILQYLTDVKTKITGSTGGCENPNLKAAGEVPPPVIVLPPGEEGRTCEDEPTALACLAPNNAELVRQVKSYLIGRGQQFNTLCDAFEIVKRVAWALRNEGVGLLTTSHTTKCNGFSADIIAYTDDSGVDILANAGPPDNVNGPAWQPAPATGESGVGYSPAIDPGDPSDACYFTRTCP